MRVEEIALRQEIRQMLAEAGITRESLREMAKEVLREEVTKRAKHAVEQMNVPSIVRSNINSWEFKEALRNAVKFEIQDRIDVSVHIK